MNKIHSAIILTLGLGMSSGLWAEPATAPAVAKKPSQIGLMIPEAQLFRSHKEVYQSQGEPILVILHVPKESGRVFIEVFNRTKTEVSLFQFTLSALGHEGELEFDDLPAGWSSVKEVQLSSVRELAIRNAKAYNSNADEITPRLVLHQIEAGSNPPKLGRRKI